MVFVSKNACILADLHGYAPTMKYLKIVTEKCDYLIIAGDITSADMGSSPEPVFNFLDSLNIPVIAVLGNSDRLEFLYDFQTLKNVKLLHFEIENIENVVIIGVSGVQPQDHGAFYYIPETQFYNGLKKLYEQAGKPDHFLLLSHAPPYGFADLLKNGEHVGSKGLQKFDEEFNPDIHICGHVHEAAGIYRHKSTTIINPGLQKPRSPVLKLKIPELVIENINP